MALPTLLIIGRPNVGKSTLFNRLSKQKKAIVCDFPGVTRDLIFNYCSWEKHRFILIDSGGIFFEGVDEKTSPFQTQIEAMVRTAITTADYIFFVASAEDNLTPYDQVIARNLMPFKEKVSLIVNKTDELEQARNLMEFHRLGFSRLSFVSATQAKGIDSMMEDVFAHLPPDKQGFNQSPQGDAIAVSIVGRPNAGKSSILNALAGTERSLVSDIPGTTRDSIDHMIIADKQPYLFVDTAGLKKKSKNEDGIDFYSYVRTLRSIDESKVSLFILDATQPITDQDKHIASLLEDYGNGIIIVLNKWDLVEKDTHTLERFTEYVYHQLPFLEYAPIVAISAVTRKRLGNIFELINTVYHESTKPISRKALNEFLSHFNQSSKSALLRSGKGRIHYMLKENDASFKLYVNKVAVFKQPFTRYFIKQMRTAFGFLGTPIHIYYQGLEKNKHETVSTKKRKHF